jgi:O-antigen/teichoic acid export membrane protein
MRPGSHDVTTAAGRSGERYRRAALTTSASIVARVLALATLFISIRVVANTTSAEAFGLWLLLVTAVTLVGFADFGIGNGLLNVIADALGRDDQDFTREAIASAFFALTALALALGVIFALVYPHVRWASLYNINGAAADEAGPATIAFVACLLVSLPVGIAQRVNHAHQLGWIANLWQAAGSFLSLIGIVVASAADASIAVLVAVILAGPPVAYVVDSIVLFFWSRPDLRPRLRTASVRAAQRLLQRGALFFVLATVVAVSYESDSLVISHFLGADQVQTYAVPFRLFMLAPTAVAVLITPLWPAYGEAVARHDHEWVHLTLRRSLLVGFIATLIPSLLLIPLAPPIIDVWVRGAVHPPIGLLIGIAIWAVMNGISSAVATFFNGAGVLRLQVVVAMLIGIANLALSIVLVQHLGVSGPIWATVITQGLIGMVPAWFICRSLIGGTPDPEAMSRWLARWADHVESPIAATPPLPAASD